MEVCHKHTYEDSTMKPTKHRVEKREEGRRRNITEEVTLFKVCCTHVWNYWNEIPYVTTA
jgi:hypothetical protein